MAFIRGVFFFVVFSVIFLSLSLSTYHRYRTAYKKTTISPPHALISSCMCVGMCSVLFE